MQDETLPDEMKEKLEGKRSNDTVLGRPPIAPEMRGSTDVSDVSWRADIAVLDCLRGLGNAGALLAVHRTVRHAYRTPG